MVMEQEVVLPMPSERVASSTISSHAKGKMLVFHAILLGILHILWILTWILKFCLMESLYRCENRIHNDITIVAICIFGHVPGSSPLSNEKH